LVAGDLAGYRGDSLTKAKLTQESLAVAKQIGDKKRIASALMEMGLVERDHNYSKAIQFFTESLGMFRELNEDLWVYRTSFLLAETYLIKGNLEAARPLWKQGLDLARAGHDKFHMAWALEGLGNLERLEKHYEQAGQLYRESLNLKVSVMDKMGMTYSFAVFAQLAAAQQQFIRAAALWGAAERLGETLNFLLIPSEENTYTSLILETRTQLGPESFEAAWAEGKAMKMKAAIEYALKLSGD
jgi:tetratricopeptide (TPR) repeat protein